MACSIHVGRSWPRAIQTISDDTDPRYAYEYGANGAASAVRDRALGRERVVAYDLANRPVQSTLRDAVTGEELYQTALLYDKYNNVSKFKERAYGTSYQTAYSYDTENRPTNVKYMDDANKAVSYAYDGLGRISARTVKNGASSTATSTYTYVPGRPGVTGGTTPLVAGIAQPGISFAYEYDSRGNITKETRTPQDGTAVEITYDYDSMSQLTRVNDPTDTTAGVDGTTWVYAYDLGGNIQSKTRYAYTTGAPDTAQQTIAYGYGDANWKDKLTSYDGTAITYDAIGNTIDDGTWTYTWRAGRQLAGMAKKETAESYEFRYNEEGLRVQKIKKVGDVVTETTDYTLHGKRVTHLCKGSDSLHFFYDAQGKPAIARFNGMDYRYVHNLQGDIVGMVDSAGATVVEYRWDAWGKLLATTGTLTTTLGVLNPFRYRGYVYDEEIKSYYLRSRYYNPEWGRFMRADYLLGEIGCLLNRNAYAYCACEPVNRLDVDGAKVVEDFYNATWLDPYTMQIPKDQKIITIIKYTTKSVGGQAVEIKDVHTYIPYYLADEYFLDEYLRRDGDILDGAADVIGSATGTELASKLLQHMTGAEPGWLFYLFGMVLGTWDVIEKGVYSHNVEAAIATAEANKSYVVTQEIYVRSYPRDASYSEQRYVVAWGPDGIGG